MTASAIGGVSARVAGILLTAMIHLWLARELGPAGYGSFVLALVVHGTAALVANVGLGSGVAYRIARTPDRARSFLLAGVLAASANAVLALALLVPFAIARIDPFPTVATGWLVFALAAVPMRSLQEIFAGASVGLGVSGGSLALSVAIPVYLIAGLATLAAGDRISEPAVASAWALAQAGALVTATVVAFRVLPQDRWDVKDAARSFRAVFTIGTQQTLNMAAWWLLVRTDRSLVGAAAGAAAAGRFALATSLVDVILNIPSVIALVSFPRLAREHADRATELLQRLSRWSTTLIAGVFALSYLAAVVLTEAILGPAYSEMPLLLLALAPGAIALTPATLMGSYFLAVLGRPSLTLLSTSAALAVMVPAVWYLTHASGIVGAAVGTSFSQMAAGTVALAVFALKSRTRWQRAVLPTASDGRSVFRVLASIGRFRG